MIQLQNRNRKIVTKNKKKNGLLSHVSVLSLLVLRRIYREIFGKSLEKEAEMMLENFIKELRA